jgi:prepilin peptidase CpaA
MIVTVLLLAWTATAAVTDVWKQRVYNWTTYSGIAAALAINTLGEYLERTSEPSQRLQRLVGWVGLQDSVAGLLVCGLCMLVCFVFFEIGGGDVKLVTMLGAFLGWEQGVAAMLWTFVLGGCFGVVMLIWRVGLWRLLVQSFRHVRATVKARGWLPLSEDERRQLQPPLFVAPMALAAAAITRFELVERLLP